jgi:methyl-accepting chemotaxis protein
MLVLALIGVNFWGSVQFNTFIQTTEEDQIPEILNISTAVQQIHEANSEVYAAILSNNPTRIQSLVDASRKEIEAALEKIGTYTSGIHPDSEKELIQRLSVEVKDWSTEMQKLMAFSQANTPDADQQAADLLAQDPDKALIEDLSKVVELNEREANETKDQAGHNFQTVIIATIGFAFAVLAVIFTVLWLLSRSVIKMTNDIERLNAETSKALSDNNRRFGESASIRLKAITAQLDATTMQQASRSYQQASSVGEVTNSLNELGETSRQIAINAKQVDSVARETFVRTSSVGEATRLAIQSTEQGQLAVASSISAIEEVREGITNLAQQLIALTGRSKQINSIISLIKTIADETHLLALNAAIESAGAGNSGQRFGVVASEVKNLADRSLEATFEVSQIVNEFQGAIATAVLASEETRKRTYGAVDRSIQAGQTIIELGQVVTTTAQSTAQIEEMVKQAVVLSEEINFATQQQNSAVRQIISTMEGIEVMAQENASSVSQISNTIGQIDQISGQLKEALGGNKLTFLTDQTETLAA